jgi:hypothetical protein
MGHCLDTRWDIFTILALDADRFNIWHLNTRLES